MHPAHWLVKPTSTLFCPGDDIDIDRADEDDDARGRGMAVSGSSRHGDETTDAAVPSRMRVAGAPDRRKLAALLEAARLLNACLGHHIRDRVTGRFYPPDFHEILNGLAYADQDHLSDGDYVAVLVEGRHGARVRVGLVEGLMSPFGRSRKLTTTRRLAMSNPEGRLNVRVLHDKPKRK